MASYTTPLASLYLGKLSEVSLKYVLELTRVCPAEDVTYCWYGIPIDCVTMLLFKLIFNY